MQREAAGGGAEEAGAPSPGRRRARPPAFPPASGQALGAAGWCAQEAPVRTDSELQPGRC